MATKKIDEASLAARIAGLDDGEVYAVVLARPLRLGQSLVRPGDGVELKGKVIKENAHDIADLPPVAR